MNRGNPVALGLVMIGAAMMVVATFLPLYEPAGLFRMIQENSLIQHGGWTLVAAAIGVAATGYRARLGKGWAAPLGVALLAAAGLAFFAFDKSQRTLYPVSLNGTVDSSGPGTIAEFGIGIYVAGLGIALAAVGSLMLRQGDESAAGSAGTKKCPDCAETILTDAQVCKHCGYRFPAGSLDPPAADASARPRRMVRCHSCQAIETVAAGATKAVCSSCKTPMKLQSPSA